MTTFRDFAPIGVIPAAILPFCEDFSIDAQSYRKHLRDLAGVQGITAITINAHATEVASCSLDEQREVLGLSADEIGDRMPLVHGVYADGSIEAARIARMAADGGAAALLVFPPNPYILGKNLEMVLTHFRRIAEVTDLPLIAFQYPLAGGQGYSLDFLLKLIDAVPTVRAIKDWCNLVPQHERHIRVLQSLPRPVTVLSTHSAWLLSSLVLGCNGLLSGMGSVVADLQVALFQAVRSGDLRHAQAINDRLYPLAEVFYADPFVDMHNRMKEALVALGRIPRAAVRPPLTKLSAAEVARIRAALAQADVRPAGAVLPAAA